MKLPNKVISYQESIFPKFALILNAVSDEPKEVLQLYEESKKPFDNINDFIEVLVLLYAIKKISFNSEGKIIYVS